MLKLTQQEARALTAFRRGPAAPVVRAILEEQLRAARAEYDATAPSVQAQVRVQTIKDLLSIAFDQNPVLK